MENPALAEGWNNRRHRVYGFNLRPFCLYYLHLLQSIGSPLVIPKARFGKEQLLIAAEICAAPWSSEGYTLDGLLRPNVLRKKRNQARLITCSFERHDAAWREYSQDFLTQLEKWDVAKGGSGPPRTDLDRVMATATTIIYCSGWSEESVMMMPIGKAFAYADYFSIQQGAEIHFITEMDKKIQELDKKQQALEKAEAERKAAAEGKEPDAPPAP